MLTLESPAPSSPEDIGAILEIARGGTMSLEHLLGQAERLTALNQSHNTILLYQNWLEHTDSPLAYAVHFNLAVVFADSGNAASAEKSYRDSIQINPQFIPSRLNLGTMLERVGRAPDALQIWFDILDLPAAVLAANADNHRQALNNIGRLLEILKRYDEAEDALAKSLELLADQPDVRQHWIHLRQKQCTWPVNSGALAMSDEKFYRSGSALSTLSLTDDPALQLAAAHRFVNDKLRKGTEILANMAGYGHRRLRIGYLSSDFCLHPVSLLMVELFERHNRDEFEIFGFCHSPEDGSELRTRVIAGFDHFHKIHQLTDEASAQLIRANEIDILVDLQGLTSGVRANIFSYRPAPVQVTWLGFPGTSGHPQIDYIIADDFILPTTSEYGYSEKPLRLPFCFQPSDNKRIVGNEPTRGQYGLPEAGFIYCCFNNNYKFTPAMFGLWMDVLAQTPGSILWLLADNKWSEANLFAQAEARGIARDRIVLAGRVSPADYLARYQLADVFLDTFPFNAGTTANDALWMGLPVLTLSGKSFASRMAGSLLTALELEEFITHSEDEYRAKAIELYHSRDRLVHAREKLLAARTSSRVYDMAHLSRDIEYAFKSIALSGVGTEISDKMTKSVSSKKAFTQYNPDGTSITSRLPIFASGLWEERHVDPDFNTMVAKLRSNDGLLGVHEQPLKAIIANHLLPRFNAYEVPKVLGNLYRALDEDGFAIIICPDLQSIIERVLANGLSEPAYQSPAGPITPLDLIFGHQGSIQSGVLSAPHRTGFTTASLTEQLQAAGFKTIRTLARPENFDLWGIASKSELSADAFSELIGKIFTA